jgi:hypothetical protein
MSDDYPDCAANSLLKEGPPFDGDPEQQFLSEEVFHGTD